MRIVSTTLDVGHEGESHPIAALPTSAGGVDRGKHLWQVGEIATARRTMMLSVAAVRLTAKTNNGKGRSRSPSGMTSKRAKGKGDSNGKDRQRQRQRPRQTQGSLHCATDDGAVRRCGRDDVTLREERAEGFRRCGGSRGGAGSRPPGRPRGTCGCRWGRWRRLRWASASPSSSCPRGPSRRIGRRW
jgi:hypothetical protein